jgi:hypothetical protein
MHRQLNLDELDAVSGYLESVQNLAACARILIREKHHELLYTILEEIAQNSQFIMEYCIVEEKE